MPATATLNGAAPPRSNTMSGAQGASSLRGDQMRAKQLIHLEHGG